MSHKTGLDLEILMQRFFHIHVGDILFCGK